MFGAIELMLVAWPQAKGINSFPTFIVFKNGKPVYRQNGFSKESILAALQKQGADLSVSSCFVELLDEHASTCFLRLAYLSWLLRTYANQSR